MEKSRRAQRMARHHKRNRRAAPLNLVSLMDIFTILVQGHKVSSVSAALAEAGPVIKPLKQALERQAARSLRRGNGAGPEVTIMGDREIPYRLLKKVMVSCTLARYGKVSLAVMQKSGEET